MIESLSQPALLRIDLGDRYQPGERPCSASPTAS
jgi:hypothetical protein